MRTPSRRFALALLVSIAPATLPQLAYAQQRVLAQAAADPTVVAARARFNEGVAFFDKGEFENARASFLQAYALHKHPAVLINLAQSSLRSGHTLDAARDFARYMHDSTNLTPAQRAEAEKGLAEARLKLGRIDVSAPAGTTVTIDGDLAGTDGSTTWDVEPGSHTVKGGGDTATVSVVAGQTASVKLGKGLTAPVPAVTPLPPEPVAGPAIEPPPPPAPVVPVVPPPEPVDGAQWYSPPKAMLPVWLGLGVAVAGFGEAIIFAVFKANATSSYNSESSTITNALMAKGVSPGGACTDSTNPAIISGCQALVSDSNAVSSDATAANVGIVVGVVGVAFAAGWYFLAPKSDAPSSAASLTKSIHVEPILGQHEQGVSLGLKF